MLKKNYFKYILINVSQKSYTEGLRAVGGAQAVQAVKAADGVTTISAIGAGHEATAFLACFLAGITRTLAAGQTRCSSTDDTNQIFKIIWH